MAKQSETSFKDNPRDWARRWKMELDAARKRLARWHKQGDDIVARFLDERAAGNQKEKRLNLFTSDVQTRRAILFGQTPKVDVSRRFADAKDDVGRVAAEIMERLLNTDIERDDDTYAEALDNALNDYELPGLGIARIRYVANFEIDESTAQEAKLDEETGAELAAAVPAQEVKSDEDVETDYVFWKDFLFGTGRVWSEVPWVAFRSNMSRSELVKRFGKAGEKVALNGRKRGEEDEETRDVWSRAEVWEIWDKESGQVFWITAGLDEVLDRKEDPYQLPGFFPCPRPMMANLTTTKLIPRPDYVLHQDGYNEVDSLTTRINLLQKAIRVAGAYDKSAAEVKRLLSEAGFNEMIGVENWPAFSEKGGFKGSVDWFPLEQVTAALSILREQRREAIDLQHQVTGMSDVMRGQQTSPGVTATAEGIKAKFGSVRMQQRQDEFARFASDLQRLRAHLIATMFEPATIMERCNCEYGFDQQLVPQAIELIRSKFSSYRIQVKPENVSLTDFAAQRSERTEVLTAVASYFQAIQPLATQAPAAMPYLLEILQWMVAGIRGGSGIESILDQAIDKAKELAAQPAPQQQDTKLAAQQLKGQQDLVKIDKELQADLVRNQADAQLEENKQRTQAEWNVREHAMTAAIPKPPPSDQGGGLGAASGGGVAR